MNTWTIHWVRSGVNLMTEQPHPQILIDFPVSHDTARDIFKIRRLHGNFISKPGRHQLKIIFTEDHKGKKMEVAVTFPDLVSGDPAWVAKVIKAAKIPTYCVIITDQPEWPPEGQEGP